MSKVFCVSMNKGGVGKTSLVTNLSGALSIKYPDKKILIIDTDGQGNSALSFGIKMKDIDKNISDVLLGDCKAKYAIIKIQKNLHLIPATEDMNYIDFDVLTNINKYKKPFDLLKNALNPVKKDYDFIIVDTPPSLGLVAGNVLNFADQALIPFVPETFSVNGLIKILESIEGFRAKNNPKLELLGVVGMMVDSRTVLHSEMLQKARQYVEGKGVKMFDTVIPKSIRFAAATAYEQKPAVFIDQSHDITNSYFNLLKEVMADGS